MEWITRYLMSVIAAAILCAAAKSFLSSKGTASAMVKMMCGLFLAITMIAPWNGVDWNVLRVNQDELEGIEAIEAGANYSQSAIEDLVRENIKAHILDKAAYLEMSIDVQVDVGAQYPPIPEKITITGAVSPYAKKVLSKYIESELGVPEEKQIWT